MKSTVTTVSALLLGVLCCLFLLACPKHRQAHDLTPSEIADRAKPATILIVTEVEATATVPELSIDTTALGVAVADTISRDATPSDKIRILLNTLLSDPARFLVKSSTNRVNKTQVHYLGSGFIVTPDGYIATNAHVVQPKVDDLKESLIKSVKGWIEKDVTDLEEEIERLLPQSRMTNEARERLVTVLAEYYSQMGDITNLSSHITAVLGYTGSGSDPSVVRFSCEIKKIGKPIPGKDIAILKMDGSDLPTVSLASNVANAGLKTGSEINVVGFPGELISLTDIQQSSRLESSQTTGHVSDIKTMEDGWKIVQTDAGMNPGNSGGPAFDNRGEVIGLATSQLKGEQGINFVVSVDLLNEFLADLNITPSTSAYTQTYLDALDDLQLGHQSKALGRFEKLRQIHPGIRVVEDYVHNLRAQGTTATPMDESGVAGPSSGQSPGRPNRAVLVLGAVGLLVAIILVFVVVAKPR